MDICKIEEAKSVNCLNIDDVIRWDMAGMVKAGDRILPGLLERCSGRPL